MKNFNEYLKSIKNIVNEHALHKDKIINIKQLYNSGKYKETLNEINYFYNLIIDELKNINITDIKISNNRVSGDYINHLVVSYGYKIDGYILDLMHSLEEVENDPNIIMKYFPDGYNEFNLSVDINPYNFNEIHIINNLPYCLKGIGLGKKIIKSVIKFCGFISLQKYTNPSDEFISVFHSLSKDSNYYTFVDENESILVFDKIDKSDIIPIVKDFLKDSSTYAIDDDFLKDFKLTEKDII